MALRQMGCFKRLIGHRCHLGSNRHGWGPSSPVVLRCHFCDEDGHTIITTAKGNKIIPYYVCKKFCELSAANRFLQLQAKNLCTSCLYPGAPKGPPHRCYFLQFCCPHPSHPKSARVHVLVCETHKKDPKNLELLEKFKEKFIKNCKVSLPDYGKNISGIIICLIWLRNDVLLILRSRKCIQLILSIHLLLKPIFLKKLEKEEIFLILSNA